MSVIVALICRRPVNSSSAGLIWVPVLLPSIMLFGTNTIRKPESHHRDDAAQTVVDLDLALLFVLPPVGGFAFVTRFALLRYATGREESQRLYYRAAFYGLIFAIGAGAAHSVARNHVVTYARFVDALASDAVLPLLEKDRMQSTVAPTREAVRVRIDVALIQWVMTSNLTLEVT